MNGQNDEVSDPKSAFFAAVTAGDLASVRSYLERDGSLATAIDDRPLPSFDGVWNERPLIFKSGLMGEEPKPFSPSVVTPLHVAVQHNHLEIVRLLVALGANVNALTRAQNTPLHYAVTYKFLNLELIQFLVEHGADVNANGPGSTPLYRTLRWDRDPLPVVEFLLESGADVNAETRSQGRTPLDCAVMLFGSPRDHVPLIETLLRFGANVNPIRGEQRPFTDPPLRMVALHNNVPVARLLLAAGADPNEPTRWGTPLYAAMSLGFDQMVELLLNAGADPNCVDKEGRSPLDLTAPYEHTLTRVENLLQEQGRYKP